MTAFVAERGITPIVAPDAKCQLENGSSDIFSQFVNGLDQTRLVKLGMSGKSETISWIGFEPRLNGNGQIPEGSGKDVLIGWLLKSRATGYLEIIASNGKYNGVTERIAIKSGEIVCQDPPPSDFALQPSLF